MPALNDSSGGKPAVQHIAAQQPGLVTIDDVRLQEALKESAALKAAVAEQQQS